MITLLITLKDRVLLLMEEQKQNMKKPCKGYVLDSPYRSVVNLYIVTKRMLFIYTYFRLFGGDIGVVLIIYNIYSVVVLYNRVTKKLNDEFLFNPYIPDGVVDDPTLRPITMEIGSAGSIIKSSSEKKEF